MSKSTLKKPGSKAKYVSPNTAKLRSAYEAYRARGKEASLKAFAAARKARS